MLEQRLRAEGAACEISYTPREISSDICNMGLKVPEHELQHVLRIAQSSGFTDIMVYEETVLCDRMQYTRYKGQ